MESFQRVLYFSPYLDGDIDLSMYCKFFKSAVLSGARISGCDKSGSINCYLEQYGCYFSAVLSSNDDIYINCWFIEGGAMSIDAFKEIINIDYPG